MNFDSFANALVKPAVNPKTVNTELESFRKVFSTISDGLLHAKLAEKINLSSTIPIIVGNLSTECLEDVLVMGEAVLKLITSQPTDMEFVLLQILVLDSNGAREAGILRGNGAFKFYGFKQECDIINYKVPGRDRTLTTMYSRAIINPELVDENLTGDISIVYDLCQPASCSSEDLEFIIAFALDTAGVAVNPVRAVLTMDDVAVPYTFASWIVGAVIIAIVALSVFAGIVDFFEIVDRDSSSFSIKMLLTFSIYKNSLEILNMAESRQGQIAPLNCVRALSILWIIAGHAVGQFAVRLYNPQDGRVIVNYFFFQILMNGFFSVDSFFFMGGLVVSYVWFKNFNKDRKVLTQAKSWVLYCVHRYLRISPPYFMLIFFYMYILLPYTSHSPDKLRYPIVPDGCYKYFWLNMLYINNFKSNVCVGPTWYLATDMQLYILSPLILFPLALYPYGIVVPVVLWCLSVAGNIAIIFAKNATPTYPLLVSVNKYHEIYYPPWMRCPVYIQGLVLGWFLHRVKRLQIPRSVNIALGGLALALMLTVLFGLFDYNKGGDLSVFWRAMYSALSKPAWGLGLTWIVVSSFYGCGGPINRFMSWSIWNPLGRLSYCTYLVHYLVLALCFSLIENPVYYTSIWSVLIFYVIPNGVLSVAVAYLWSVFFEIPFGKLEAIFLRPKKTSTS